jgi:hypothetical protein
MIVTAAAQSSAAPEAERTAKVYMIAFFGGDMKTATDLTDPRTLERIRESFLAELVKVTDPDSEKAILANLGVARTTVELSQVDAKTLYVALTDADHRSNPQVFEAMKRTRVEVLGSAPNPTGGVTVRFRIITPAGASTSSQESGLLMREVLGAWKVVGNAP